MAVKGTEVSDVPGYKVAVKCRWMLGARGRGNGHCTELHQKGLHLRLRNRHRLKLSIDCAKLQQGSTTIPSFTEVDGGRSGVMLLVGMIWLGRRRKEEEQSFQFPLPEQGHPSIP
jgi:hypothetical protein